LIRILDATSFEHGTDIHFRKMRIKRINALFALFFISSVFSGCRKEDPANMAVPGDDQLYSVTFYLERIDSARYWGDSEKIRLKTGLIRLFPGNSTYEKKFFGTADENIDPSQANWSKESSGKYTFSADSTFFIFSNEPGKISYFSGYYSGGNFIPPRIEQHDSIGYTISLYSMAVSGRFIYQFTE
jgi:hypothetical protein